MDKVLGFIKSFVPELVVILSIGVLLGLNAGVFEIDPYSEFFHIESAKESLMAGRFWMPILSGHDYLVRAPLWTWIVEICFKLMGVSLWAARLPAVICSVLGLVFTYLLTLQLTKSRFSGFFAAGVLGTMWGYFHLGSLSTADSLASALYIAFAWTFLQWHSFAGRRTVISIEMNTFSGVFGFILGILILLKGSLTVGLLLLVAFIYLMLTQSFHLLQRLNVGLVLGPLFLLPLPWLIWASTHSGNPMFIYDYLLGHPWARFVGAGPWQGLQADFLFYLKRLPLDLLPYIVFLPAILLDEGLIIRRGATHTQPWIIWLLLWFLAGVLTCSLSVFHEPTRMLAFYPPLAVLLGYYFGQVMEAAASPKTSSYNGSLIVCIGLMMLGAVIGTVLIFQVIPSNYVAGFWHLPGQSVIESLQFGKHQVDLPEAFPLWKFWLIPGPFILLIGGFALFLLQSERRLSPTPLTLVGTFIVMLLFIKALYLPIMHRPVSESLARQLNHIAKKGDLIVLYSLHPDIKRALFYLQGDKLAYTRIARTPALIQQNLEREKGTLYGIMRESSFFNELKPEARNLLQVNQYNWDWDTSRTSELTRFLGIRQPRFDNMKSGLISFRSLPQVSLQAMREAQAQEELMANPEAYARKKRRR
ncbi:MAG: glycosyl transferase [Vampirovibrio sp.]|jgi:4-amino-4-deoxy-L-arabinose transferase-like glycosyltransferase|nr:glycosyl transferase [Vampirovibrio sp.]